MNEIKCPHDLNQFLLGEPIFKNTFPEEECKQRKFYGDCYHCFSTAIASRDHQLKTDEVIKAAVQFLLEHEEAMNFNYHGKRYRLAVEPQESEDK